MVETDHTAMAREQHDLRTWTGAEARIKELMEQAGHPNSISVYHALCQLHKETLMVAEEARRLGFEEGREASAKKVEELKSFLSADYAAAIRELKPGE